MQASTISIFARAWVFLVLGMLSSGAVEAQDVRTRLKDGATPDFVICDGEFDEQPRVTRISRPIPPDDVVRRYGQYALRYDMDWEVTVRFDVDEKGRPTNVRNAGTDPSIIGKAANSTLAAWRFMPAVRDGKAVSARCQVVLSYDLRTSRMKREQAARNAADR